VAGGLVLGGLCTVVGGVVGAVVGGEVTTVGGADGRVVDGGIETTVVGGCVGGGWVVDAGTSAD
jgi:hypothetical protein